MKIGVFFDHLRTISDQRGVTLEQSVRQAKELGISFVHINAEFWMANESRVDELLRAAELPVASADLLVQLTQNQDMEKAENVVRFLSRKGAPHLLVIPGFVHPAQSRKAAMEQAAGHLRELVYLARSLHVQCSLEDFDNADAPFGTWQELAWFVQQVPRLRITLDTGNFLYFGQNVLEGCEKLAGHICMVHAKDRAACGRSGEKALKAMDGTELYPSAVGSGMIPMDRVMQQLKTQGYDGGVIVEHFGSADMWSDLRASCAWLQEHL